MLVKSLLTHNSVNTNWCYCKLPLKRPEVKCFARQNTDSASQRLSGCSWVTSTQDQTRDLLCYQHRSLTARLPPSQQHIFLILISPICFSVLLRSKGLNSRLSGRRIFKQPSGAHATRGKDYSRYGQLEKLLCMQCC